MNYWVGYFLTLFIVGGSMVGALILLRRVDKTVPIIENVLLMCLALFITFMGLEFYFRLFFAQPDSFDTLARRNWFETYANRETDYNSLGYRDAEWTDEMVTGKTKVMVVGDSYVHGDGIEYTEDRFSDLLAEKLGPDYVVFNLGKGGTNANHYIEAVLNYPHSPDILVVAYGINDVKGAALEQQWVNRPGSESSIDVPPLLQPLVENSYAFNFLFWHSAHLLRAQQTDDLLWDWYLDIYNTPDSWWIYQQQLLALHEGTQSEQIPLFVVVFPSMQFPEKTKVVTDRVLNVFKERGVSTLNVYDLIQGYTAKELMASQTDAHPNELVHRLVADALYQMFIDNNVVAPPTAP